VFFGAVSSGTVAMPMKLQGSCHCGAVHFSVASHTPYPYQLCYCGICRKTAGGGGFAINLMGDAATLVVHGTTKVGRFHAVIDGARSEAERRFCTACGSALWLFDKRWPDLVHPFASAIDTDLPRPPARVHMMLGSKASWVEPDIRPGDHCFDAYPEESIEEWHRARKLWIA
jgi:hypothetical protein